MVVIVLERVTPALRGELSRWLVEPRAGVFVGSVSSLVRDKLWEEIGGKLRQGAAVLVYTTNNEQGFAIRSTGDRLREIVDLEGLLLMREISR
jgi:CRISPR-associated protein Cas2